MEATGPDPSLTDVRLLAMCLVAFAGFLRCDQLIKLRCSDIVFIIRKHCNYDCRE